VPRRRWHEPSYRGARDVMSLLARNLLLALAWALLEADLSFRALLVGFVLGFFAIVLTEHALGRHRHARTAASVVVLAWTFLAELVLSSLALARDILRHRRRFHPAFIRLDVRGSTPTEMALLAALISLTPGTITVDASPDPPSLFVHALYGRDPEALRARLARFVRLVRRATGSEER
jgi:multicomponent Na+:H+ antiporter subunit E